jgi:hypothetical protein
VGQGGFRPEEVKANWVSETAQPLHLVPVVCRRKGVRIEVAQARKRGFREFYDLGIVTFVRDAQDHVTGYTYRRDDGQEIHAKKIK